MTAAARAFDFGIESFPPDNTSHGASEDASKIVDLWTFYQKDQHRSATGQIRFIEPVAQLYAVYERCKTANWDGEGALPISYGALTEAIKFWKLLSNVLFLPDIYPEAEGAIAFEWHLNSHRTYIVSLRGNHTLEFAGIFGAGNRSFGTLQFGYGIPKLILAHFNLLLRGE